MLSEEHRALDLRAVELLTSVEGEYNRLMAYQLLSAYDGTPPFSSDKNAAGHLLGFIMVGLDNSQTCDDFLRFEHGLYGLPYNDINDHFAVMLELHADPKYAENNCRAFNHAMELHITQHRASRTRPVIAGWEFSSSRPLPKVSQKALLRFKSHANSIADRLGLAVSFDAREITLTVKNGEWGQLDNAFAEIMPWGP